MPVGPSRRRPEAPRPAAEGQLTDVERPSSSVESQSSQLGHGRRIRRTIRTSSIQFTAPSSSPPSPRAGAIRRRKCGTSVTSSVTAPMTPLLRPTRPRQRGRLLAAPSIEAWPPIFARSWIDRWNISKRASTNNATAATEASGERQVGTRASFTLAQPARFPRCVRLTRMTGTYEVGRLVQGRDAVFFSLPELAIRAHHLRLVGGACLAERDQQPLPAPAHGHASRTDGILQGLLLRVVGLILALGLERLAVSRCGIDASLSDDADAIGTTYLRAQMLADRSATSRWTCSGATPFSRSMSRQGCRQRHVEAATAEAVHSFSVASGASRAISIERPRRRRATSLRRDPRRDDQQQDRAGHRLNNRVPPAVPGSS